VPPPHPVASKRVSLQLACLVPSSRAATFEQAPQAAGTEPAPGPTDGQRGCAGACCSANSFSFLLQTPFQHQRWLRRTLCLSPWARGRYVLAVPGSRLSQWAGGGQGEGQSQSSGARKAAQRAVKRWERRKQGTPSSARGNVPPACSNTSWVFFISFFAAQPCPALYQAVTAAPESHVLLFDLPCQRRQAGRVGRGAAKRVVGTAEQGGEQP